MRRLVFENRAWKGAEHPRYVSEPLKISKNEKRVFEISYHYVEGRYYVETHETRVRSDGRRETYGGLRFFDSLDDCFDYVEKTYNVKTVRKDC